MPKVPADKPEQPIKAFRSGDDWETWLDRHHRDSKGIWLRLAKKGSTVASVTYAEALETALCYGWIDAQKKPESDTTWLQRFVPRSPRSLWSKINCEKATALIAQARMKPAGLEAVENAKRTGRWDAAYDSGSRSTVPPDFAAALDASPRAHRFFETLDRANRYAILWRIQTVKRPETRARKIRDFTAMLERGEKIH